MTFLAKAIDKAQRLDPSAKITPAITEYIIRRGALAYDFKRQLFWVKHPDNGWQVAIWMIVRGAEVTTDEKNRN